MTTTHDRAVGRSAVSLRTRCAAIARKFGPGALKVLWLVATGLAGLLASEWLLAKSISLGIPPSIVLRALAAFIALLVFWTAYDLPFDVWHLWHRSRERKS